MKYTFKIVFKVSVGGKVSLVINNGELRERKRVMFTVDQLCKSQRLKASKARLDDIKNSQLKSGAGFFFEVKQI